MTRYLEVSISCSRRATEPLMDLVGGVAGGGAVVDDPRDIVSARREGRWDYDDFRLPDDLDRLTVRGYLPDAGDLEERRLRLESGLTSLRRLDIGEIGPVQVCWVDEDDWAAAWKQFFTPLEFGRRLAVVPPWHTGIYDPGERSSIVLDPGMAFGTGQHATTALCLEWLEELVVPGSRVVDIGCGSGILSVAAVRLGARAVLALDTDPVAARVTRENCERNGVAGAVTVVHGSLEADQAAAWLGAGDPPPLVVANIVADVITALAPAVAGQLPPGGRWLTAGIISPRSTGVEAALRQAGLVVEAQRSAGDWRAVLARRP